MSQAIARNYYTAQEYLALEDKAEYKSEYYQGEIFQMAGGSINHSRIARNICTALEDAFAERPCEAFNSDAKLKVEAINFFAYPDTMALCGEIRTAAESDEIITNPSVIVEVLSDSTANYDRTTKFGFYRALESLQTYVLIDQHRVYIERFQLNEAGKWEYDTIDEVEGVLELLILDVKIPITRIYRKVQFETVGH